MQNITVQIRQLLDSLPDFAVAIIAVILLINAIAWFFLPFAIFGIKAKMNESRKIQEEILKIMREIE
jgi:hypothetical protein